MTWSIEPRAATSSGGFTAVIWVGAVVAGELLALSVLYNNAFTFECRARASAIFCGGLSLMVVRATIAMALAVMTLWPHRLALLDTIARARAAPNRPALALNLAGLAMILGPWFFLGDASSQTTFHAAVALWLVGALCAGAGAMLALAPAQAWLRAARLGGAKLALAVMLAFAAPEIAASAQTIWKVEALAAVTFDAAWALLSLFSDNVVSEPSQVLLGVDAFMVLVGPQCSGIEGFALITGFMGFYLWLYRADLRFPRALVLIPIGIALSWMLNVVRITVLILIGANISPDLAVNGFHSHAGWLMFTLLSLSLAMAAHATPWLKRSPGAAPAAAAPRPALPPLRQDWDAARLAPFIVFMLSALLCSTFLHLPALGYPLRFLAVLAALAAFWPLIAARDWTPHVAPIGVGLAVAVLWIAADTPPEADDPLSVALAAAPAWFFAIWAATRMLGTALLVPLVEEMVFRSYIIERLAPQGRAGSPLRLALAVGVSTALFAALHGRWELAALAGLAFAGCALWRGRLTDAVWSHVAANAAIAAWALMMGRWSVI